MRRLAGVFAAVILLAGHAAAQQLSGPPALPLSGGTLGAGSKLSLPNLEAVRYADQFAGGSVGAQIDAAAADLGGAPGVVIIPSTMGAGNTLVGLPDGVTTIDYRGVSAASSSVLTGAEFSARNSAVQSIFHSRQPITVRTDDYAGGVNGASKTQSSNLRGFYDKRDLGEGHGFVQAYLNNIGGGDLAGDMLYQRCWGGYYFSGDEGCEVYRGWANAGDGTSGGGVPASASITVSGLNISGTWVNAHNLGVRAAPLLDLTATTDNAGSVTSAAFGGGVCTVTGTGTDWATKWGAGSTSTLFIRLNQYEAGTAKFVVPIASITDNTHLVLNYQVNESGAGCPSPAIVSGSYTIYQGSAITALGAPVSGTVDPNTVTVASAAPFTTGDAVEQPIDYNVTMKIVSGTMYSPFSVVMNSNGVKIANIGPGLLDAGIRIDGGSGGYTNGIVYTNTLGSSVIKSNAAPIFYQNADSASASIDLFNMLNTGGTQGRKLLYNRTSDLWSFTGASGLAVVSINGSNGQIVSPLATGTAPFSVASTTTVANLDAATVGGGHTIANPGPIGAGTATPGITQGGAAVGNTPYFVCKQSSYVSNTGSTTNNLLGSCDVPRGTMGATSILRIMAYGQPCSASVTPFGACGAVNTGTCNGRINWSTSNSAGSGTAIIATNAVTAGQSWSSTSQVANTASNAQHIDATRYNQTGSSNTQIAALATLDTSSGSGTDTFVTFQMQNSVSGDICGYSWTVELIP